MKTFIYIRSKIEDCHSQLYFILKAFNSCTNDNVAYTQPVKTGQLATGGGVSCMPRMLWSRSDRHLSLSMSGDNRACMIDR